MDTPDRIRSYILTNKRETDRILLVENTDGRFYIKVSLVSRE